ncbi:DUF4158 domain-containing protein [Peribacillus sp. NPDC097895]|uniref:DUF4158 domain-containing protein n=1 Tax=Peribacillus sp. NPDC097895 TaxID=3390619 RepID=UPI003D060A8C
MNRHRRDHNRLGSELQLCHLRYPGCTETNMLEIPITLLHVVKQIDVNQLQRGSAFNRLIYAIVYEIRAI